MAVPTLVRVRKRAKAAFLQGISTRPKKNLHFYSLFCDFCLAFCIFLGYSPLRPGFFGEKRG
jgi:hypothetical protein